MSILFGKDKLAKVLAEAGHCREKLEQFGTKEVSQNFNKLYDIALDNLLAANLSVATIQFDFISKIEFFAATSTENSTDPYYLLTDKIKVMGLKEKAIGYSEIVVLIENLINNRNTPEFLDIRMELLEIKEALNELLVNSLYTTYFIEKYIEAIKLKIKELSTSSLIVLMNIGDLKSYQKIYDLIEA